MERDGDLCVVLSSIADLGPFGGLFGGPQARLAEASTRGLVVL